MMGDRGNIQISFMQKEDLEESAGVLSIAMMDNPLHLAVFQGSGEGTRTEIEKDFTSLLRDKPGIVFIAKEDQKIIGVMRMNSCSGKKTVDNKAEPDDENNMDWRKTVWLNVWAQKDPKDQHWHLGPVGVLPAYQGIGVGSLLMGRFCSEVDACSASAYLETDKDENVSFYEKFGFKTISDALIFGVRNRFMVRAATQSTH